jgi:hypothetical protein
LEKQEKELNFGQQEVRFTLFVLFLSLCLVFFSFFDENVWHERDLSLIFAL